MWGVWGGGNLQSFNLNLILRKTVRSVSKDVPLVPECAAHPSRQAFGLPQDEVE